MMFDLLFCKTFKYGKEISVDFVERYFENSKTYKKINAEKIKHNIDSVCYYGLARNAREYFEYDTERNIVLIIGEIYLSEKGRAIINTKQSLLKACEVNSIMEKYESNALDYIKGNFTLLNYDKVKDKVTIINNRFGLTPVYHAKTQSHFIFSTSLKILQKCFSDIKDADEVAILESQIFNYPLGGKTILKDVSAMLPGEIVEFHGNFVERRIWWDCKSLYNSTLIPLEESYEQAVEKFKRAVDIRISDQKNITCSLTGGFDGRAILSVIKDRNKNLILYSFGINGSKNVNIPFDIAKKEGIYFMPIILDEIYEAKYSEYAEESVVLSDNLRTIESANYPYAFEKLRAHSSVVLTGICGSELLRTFQNVGLMVSNAFVELNNYSNDNDIWKKLEKKLIERSYVSSRIIKENIEEVKCHFEQAVWNQIKELPVNKRFYIYLLKEGLRKYFGGEILSERIYATNRIPFIDEDFVFQIFKSPFSGVYSTALKPTVNQKFRSQYFYGKVMSKYYPQLLDYSTDHGYKAKCIVSKYPVSSLAFPYIWNKVKRKLTKYKEFKPVSWAELYYENNTAAKFLSDGYFNAKLSKDYYSGDWKNNYTSFNRATSLNIWMNA